VAKREIAEQDDRQEQKDEGMGVEEHRAFPGGLKSLTIQRGSQQDWGRRPIWQFAFSSRYSVDDAYPDRHARA
jgi:hypothetical protein